MSRACMDCSELLEAGRGKRCGSCRRARAAGRPNNTALGYTPRWRELSKRYRRAVPYCEIRGPGCQRVAVEVDHKIPLRPPAYGKSTWSNCQSVCKPCHVAKTRADAERWAA